MSKIELSILLARQLKKHGISFGELPVDLSEWQNFLQRIDKTYSEFNEARINSDNILEVSLKEMERLQEELSESNQKKLKELNDYLTLILYASDLGTWDWDLKTNQIKYDEKWCEMLGLNPNEVCHTIDTFFSRINPDDVDKVLKNTNDYISQKIPKFEIRFKIRHSDGHWIDILSKGKVINFDTDGSPTRFIGTNLDVSEEAKLQNEIETQKLKLIRTSKLAALGELSAGIAHEINNPLAIIVASTELLPMFLDQPTVFNERLEKINKACLRMTKIVKGLKKFSRTPDDLNRKLHLLNNIIEESLLLVEAKSLQFETPVYFEPSGEHSILCDEIEIEQVIVNLIQNAIDAIKHLEEKWVKVFLFDEKEQVVLRIVDAGKGIPPAVAQKIFHAFFTTKPVGEGTGLGLSISKGILDEHKATIDILHDLPNTCFEIRFPKA